MAFCSKCGNELRVSAKFCPKCGTSVNQTTVNTEIPTKSKSKKSSKSVSFLKFVALLIPLLIGLFAFTYNFAPSIHSKLFNWLPIFEAPSVVAYNYVKCLKEGNTVGMMDFAITNAYPSRAEMKKNMQEIENSTSSRESFEAFSKLIKWGLENDGGVKDFSIVSQNFRDNNNATVEIEYVRESGLKETRNLDLKKDEDGKWCVYLKLE